MTENLKEYFMEKLQALEEDLYKLRNHITQRQKFAGARSAERKRMEPIRNRIGTSSSMMGNLFNLAQHLQPVVKK